MNFRNTYLGIEYDLFSNGKLAMSMLPGITDVAMNGQISIRHNKIVIISQGNLNDVDHFQIPNNIR